MINTSPDSIVELTQNVLSVAPVALVLVDRDGRMLLVNRHAATLFGYTPEELVGRKVDVLVPERYRQDHPDKRRAFVAAQSERPMGFGAEVVGRRKDGSEFPVELGLTPFTHTTGTYTLAALFDLAERRRADAAALHLANVVNSSADAICSATFDGVVQSWNDGATGIFGYTADEMVGQRISILVPDDRAGEEARLLQRLRDGITCDHFETVRRHKNGKPIDVSLTLSSIRDRSGQVVGVSSVARDLTKQKQLERQQQRFFDGSLDLLAVAGLDGFVRKANPAMMRTFGYGESDLRSRPFLELIHPDDVPSVREAVEQLRTGSSMVGFEVRCRTASGCYRLLRWNIVPDAESGLLHASGRDVTERNEQLRLLALGRDVGFALAQRTTLIQMLQRCADAIVSHLDAACARIWTLPEDSAVLELQASAGLAPDLEGRRKRIPIGQSTIGTIAQHRRPHVIDNLAGECQEDDLEWARLEGLVAFAGQPLIVDERVVGVVAILVRHELSAAVVGALASIADMIAVGIDRRYADAALARSEAEAQSANRAKSEFLANMSHEIRTPMNGVLGMTRLLMDSELAGKQREYVQMAHRSAESLLGVINDVLDFSKIEAGKLTLDVRPFSPLQVAEDAIRDVSLRAHAKHLELTLDVASAMPAMLLGDPDRLRQVLMNLLGNAIKFTPRGEVVLTIRSTGVSSSEADLELSVKDTGIGIADEHLRRIFTAFEQGDSSVARAYGGTGLGLSISARIVSLMGGALKVESAVAVGSTFRFTVRCAVIEPQPERSTERIDAIVAGRRVLVVDDNATHRHAVCATLTRWAVDCQGASDGAEALRALRGAVNAGRPFSLLILDAVMPKVDGFRVADALASCRDFDGTKVLMMVPGGEPDAEAQCRSRSMRSTTKPLMPSVLLENITTMLTTPAASEPALIAAPVRDAAAREALVSAMRPAAPGVDARQHRPLRILLAEDNVINQKVAVAMLESAGHSVFIAHDGSEAVTALKHAGFDVVLMDVQMPVMDGLQATAAIREYEKQGEHRTPIVALTAHAMKGDRERLLAAGMDDYVAKPVRPEALLGAIARCTATTAPPPESVVAAPANDLIDLESLVAELGGRDVVNDLLGIAGSELARLMEQIGMAHAAQRYDDVRTLAHTTKGALSNLRALGSAGVAARLERACTEGSDQAIALSFAELQQEVARVIDAAAQLREGFAGCEA